MKLLEFKKIHSRLVFWFLLTSFVPLLISIIVSFTSQTRINNLNIFDKLVSIRNLKVGEVNQWLDERIGDIRIIAGNNDLKSLGEFFATEELVSADNEKVMQIEEYLDREILSNEDYSDIYVVSASTGQVRISTNESLKGQIKLNEPYFTEPLKSSEVYISAIKRSQYSQGPVMQFSAPVFGSADEAVPVAVVVAQINLETSLYALLLNRVGLGETGETLIVNKNGVALNQLRWYGDAPLRLRITAKPAVYAARGETGIIKTNDYRQEKVLAAYTYIPRTGWGFVSKQDTKELNAPLQKTALLFILILVLTGAAIIIVTLRFSNTISKPIVKMNEIAQKMRLGDFSARNNIHSIDELGMLELEFNNMADEIESRIHIRDQIQKISETMLKENEMQQFSNNLLYSLTDITNADKAIFYILNEFKSIYEPFSSVGNFGDALKNINFLDPPAEIAKTIFTKELNHSREIKENSFFQFQTEEGKMVPKEIISIPVVVDNIVVALIVLAHQNKFSRENLQVLEQSQIGINTSYSNLLASERTRILSEQLTMINQQLEEQTEELQDQAEELQDQATELKGSTRALQKQNIMLDVQRKKVEEANKLKSEFLSNMSHELRTPLNSIMALSKLLLEQANSKLNADENNYLEIIERNGRRLLAIINDILDLSRIEAGKMEIVAQKVSVESLLYTTAENLQSLAEEKNLELSVQISNPLPMIVTDEHRLHQVLTNIVGNAIKFTETGEVRLSAIVNNDFLNIVIKDTGIGISNEMLEEIFDEFRQVDGSISRRFEGTGLGLAIAKKIMGILGGSISVKSQLGEGSEFTIHLPLKNYKGEEDTYEAFAEKDTENSDEEIEFLAENDGPGNRSNTKVLLVEDNPDMVLQMKNVLSEKGYSVVVAENGIKALEKIRDSRPDGIILDLMMPQMDGFEFLEKLRVSEKTKNTPVLVLTAKDLNKEEIVKIKKYNIQYLVRKGDINLNNLFSKIKTMLAVRSQTGKVKDEDKRSKNGKILVVEDNLDNLTTIKAIIGDEYQVTEALSGEDGLALVKKEKPRLILLDMSLPKMSGEQFLFLLRKNRKLKDIPVILVTAQAMKGDKEKFLDMGFDGYVGKPVDVEKLKNEIKKLLKKNISG